MQVNTYDPRATTHLTRVAGYSNWSPETAGELLGQLWGGCDTTLALADWCASFIPADVLAEALRILQEQEDGEVRDGCM